MRDYELKVMRRIVQKYNGTMTAENQNVLSAAKIVLPPPKSYGGTAQCPPNGLSTAPAAAARHLLCEKMLR